MLMRTILTALAVVIYGSFGRFLEYTEPLVKGQSAGQQFLPSDSAYIHNQMVQNNWGLFGTFSTILLLVVLAAIWYGPFKKALLSLAAIGLAFMALPQHRAEAYWSQYDYTEPFMVLPNETAFYVPNVGNNKDTQTEFGSAEYYQQNKISTKLFIIPHVKLPGSGTFSNYYMPAGRVIVVERTPFFREWVSSTARGTNKDDEGIHCQSSEGLDITLGVSAAASIHENQAASFLYYFGVQPLEGNRNDSATNAQSVFYARKLDTVMDTVGRGEVQTLICGEVAKRTLDADNKDADVIMNDVRPKVAKFLSERGISLDFLGWADTFQFDQQVQAAMNRLYAANKDKQVADMMKPYTDTLQKVAVADATRTVAQKFDGHLPNNISLSWMPSGLFDMIGRFFGFSGKSDGILTTHTTK